MNKINLKTIKGKKNFDAVFNKKRIFHSKKLIAIVNFRNIEQLSFSENQKAEEIVIYYAVLISKRLSKKAVVRNRIKRLLRESIKRVIKDSIENPLVFENIILSWKEKAPHHPKHIGLSDVIPFVNEALEEAYSFYITKQRKKLEADSITITQDV